MITSFKKSLIGFLKSDSIYRYIIYAAILVSAVFIFRCERQNAIDAEYNYRKAEEENERLNYQYDSVIDINKYLKIEIDGVKVQNEFLRDTLSYIKPRIDGLGKSELKKLWSDYKRHNMSND